MIDRGRRGRLLAWLVLAAVLSVTVAPLLVMLRTALTPSDLLFEADGAHHGARWTLANFARVLGLGGVDDSLAAGGSGATVGIGRAFVNSLLLTATVVVLQTTSSAMAAYAFARLRFPGRQWLFAAFMASMMLPGVVLFLPNFLLVKQLGWLNSLAGMAAPFALMSGSSIFFLRQFFITLPRDLEEAARIDGAGPFTIFWRIALPLAQTPLATIAMLTGIGIWNEFFWPFIVAPGEEFQVLPTALQAFKAQSPQGQTDWAGLMAAACVTAVPTVLLLVAFGRRVVESVQYSGGK